MTRILTEAGFNAPQFESIDLSFDLAGGMGLDAAVACALELGPSARALEGQPPEVRGAVAGSMKEFLSRFAVGDTVRMPAGIWIVSTTPA